MGNKKRLAAMSDAEFNAELQRDREAFDAKLQAAKARVKGIFKGKK